MLILTRKQGEVVTLSHPVIGEIEVTVLEAFINGHVKLGFDAPQSVKILRDNAIKRSKDDVEENTGNR